MKLPRSKCFLFGSFLSLLIPFYLAIFPTQITTQGAEKITVTVSTGNQNYSPGGLIPLASTDDPIINISTYNGSGEADISLFEASEDVVLKSFLRDKDNNQINKKIDASNLAPIASQKVFLKPLGQDNKITLPLAPNGFWILRVSVSSTSFDFIITRSENAVIVKNADKEYLFWAQNYKARKSVSGGSLKLYNLLNEKRELASADFNDQGIAQTPLLADADIGVAKFGSDEVIFPINLHYLNNSYDFRPFKPKENNTTYFIFTDRPIYKPGDTVYFKAVLRSDDDAEYSIPKGSAKVRIVKDSNFDSPIADQNFSISADGTVYGEYKLSPDAPVGYYTVKIDFPSETTEKYTYGNEASFEVQFYRKPEYSMSLTTDKMELIAAQKSSAKLSAEYFFGQPVSGKPIKYSIHSSNYYQYEFQADQPALKADSIYGYDFGAKVTSGQVTLDKNGQAEINFQAKIPPDEPDKLKEAYYEPRTGRNQVFSIQGLLDDGSGNPAYDSKNILVYAGEFDIFRKDRNYSVKVGDQFNLPLILIPHFDGEVSGISLKTQIHRTNWIPYQEPNKKYLSYKKEEEDLPEISATSDNRGSATITLTPQKVGYYKFKVTGIDKKNNPVTKTFSLYVTSPSDYYNFTGRGQLVTISSDKDKYSPGETPRLTIFSKIPDTDLLLTFERGRVRRFQIVHLQGNSTTVDTPLINSDIPNIYADISSFLDNSLQSDNINLLVSAESKKVIVKLNTDQKKYGPSDIVQVDLQTTDTKGKPLSTDLAVWAIDKAIYQIMGSSTGTIFDQFWSDRSDTTVSSHSLEGINVNQGGRGGGCFTADTQILMDGSSKPIDQIKVGDLIQTRKSENDSQLIKSKVLAVHQVSVDGILIINGNIKVTPEHKIWVNQAWIDAGSIEVGDYLTDQKGERIKVTSVEWLKAKANVYNLETENHTFFANGIFVHNDKGGVSRTIFKDTSYWNPIVHTDGAGKAHLTFKLPDNLTTYVLSALGQTTDTQAGQTSTDLIVSKDVFVRPVLPNILRVGDQTNLAGIVHNFTDKPISLDITLESDSLKISSNQKQTVTIASKDSKEIFWPVTALLEKDPAKLTFSVLENNKLLDSALVDLSIRPFGFFEKTVSLGQNNISYPIELSQKIDPTKTKISLDLSPTILGSTISAFKYLINYPYGCVEQVTSRLYPALLAKANPALFSGGLDGRNIDQIIKESLNKLYNLQNYSGWGWWQTQPANYFVTSYVLEQLSLAKNLGIFVDQASFSKAKSFLEPETPYNYAAGREEQLSSEAQVERIYGLSLLGDEKGKTKITSYDNLSPDILSLAILSNIRNGNIDPKTNGTDKLLSLAKTQGDESWFEAGSEENFGSNEASTALSIRAMVAQGLDSQTILPFIRFLVSGRNADYFANTFATAQVLKAISEYAKLTKEVTPNLSYIVSLDGKRIKEGNFADLEAEKIDIEKTKVNSASNLKIESFGQGQLYSTLTLEQFNTDKAAQAISSGLSIKREYLGENGAISVGDTVLVKLIVSGLNTKSRYGVIKDELPAGLIPINISFKNEQYYQLDDQPTVPPVPPPSPSIYDIYDQEVTENGMILSLPQMNSGTHVYTYKARAVSSGKFLAPPAQVELMYNPKVYGRSAISSVQIDSYHPKQPSPIDFISNLADNRVKVLIALTLIILISLPIGFLVYRRFKPV